MCVGFVSILHICALYTCMHAQLRLTLYTFTKYEVRVTENCREEVMRFGEGGIANFVAVTLEFISVRTEGDWVRETWVLRVSWTTIDKVMTDLVTREDGITEAAWLGKATWHI